MSSWKWSYYYTECFSAVVVSRSLDSDFTQPTDLFRTKTSVFFKIPQVVLMHSQSWESLTHMKTWLSIYLSMSMYMWMCVCKRGHRWQWAGPESKGWTYDSGRFWEEEGNPYYFAEWIQTWNIVHYVSGPQSFQHQGSFHGIQFFLRWSGLDGFRMIQAHYIYFVLYYYYISSTSGDQTLDPGGWGHLHYVENFKKMQNSRVFLQRFWVNWSSL